jgi:2-oxo-4-hydroxy-4-carboxy--5-ureidoimidazoline (OHCU) decarboxylase
MSEAAVAADHARLNETPKSNPAPNSDGRRYCRHCRELRPLSVFPAGPRRYICRGHLYERFTLPAKLRVQADDKRRVLSKLWARCSSDAKKLDQTHIKLTQSEIAGILEHTGFRIDLAFAIVPADASRMLSRENVAVVVNEARRDLISAHRKGGGRMYLSALAAWRAADSQHQQCATE